MEIIYLAIILFIVGVGATIVYDKVKAQRAAQASITPRRATRKSKSKLDPVEEEFEAFKSHMDKKRAAGNTGVAALNKLIKEAKSRQNDGHSTVTVTRGTKSQTVQVEDLIKQLEEMKKRL